MEVFETNTIGNARHMNIDSPSRHLCTPDPSEKDLLPLSDDDWNNGVRLKLDTLQFFQCSFAFAGHAWSTLHSVGPDKQQYGEIC